MRASPDARSLPTRVNGHTNGSTAQLPLANGLQSHEHATAALMPDVAESAIPATANGATTKPIDELAERLRVLRQEMGQQCADRSLYAMRETTAGIRDRRVHHGNDLFAKCRPTLAPAEQSGAMKIKFKVSRRVQVGAARYMYTDHDTATLATQERFTSRAPRTDSDQELEGARPALQVPPHRNREEYHDPPVDAHLRTALARR